MPEEQEQKESKKKETKKEQASISDSDYKITMVRLAGMLVTELQTNIAMLIKP